jgi:tetratricopeptide (TPR) repeat protein
MLQKILYTAIALAFGGTSLCAQMAGWQDHYRRGDQFLTQGKIEEARQELLSALSKAEGERLDGPKAGLILDALGRTEYQAGRYRLAAKYFDLSLQIWTPHSPEQAAGLCNAGQAYQAMGQQRRAEDSFRRALEILPQSPQIWVSLGQILFLRRRYAAAEAAQRKALTMYQDSRSPDAAIPLNDLAILYQAQLKNQQAEEALAQAVALLPAGQRRARILANLGALQWKMGRKNDAESQLRSALGEMEQAVGPGHPDVGRILEDYSAVLKKTGRGDEARSLEKRAQGIRSAFAPNDNRGGATVDWRDLKLEHPRPQRATVPNWYRKQWSAER